MTLAALLPAPYRTLVAERLDAIRLEETVAIPLAIESGSRAWGFPSPDSDYDCRFLFVRPRRDYLTLFPQRDVIELPIEGELDINGWDVAKALKLILKGNAVAIEWLRSPLAYAMDEGFRDMLLAFADRYTDRDAIRAHYLHLGRAQRSLHLGEELASLKKVFYALRPAASLRWMRMHPETRLPPMHFPTLMDEGGWPAEVEASTRELLAKKAETREMGRGVAPPEIRGFIDAELALAAKAIERRAVKAAPEAYRDADVLFHHLIAKFHPVWKKSPIVKRQVTVDDRRLCD